MRRTARILTGLLLIPLGAAFGLLDSARPAAGLPSGVEPAEVLNPAPAVVGDLPGALPPASDAPRSTTGGPSGASPAVADGPPAALPAVASDVPGALPSGHPVAPPGAASDRPDAAPVHSDLPDGGPAGSGSAGAAPTASPSGLALPASAEALPDLTTLNAIQKRLTVSDNVMMSAVDDRHQQVIVWVRSQEARERVEALIAREGIPPEWVDIEPDSGLLSERAPLRGCELSDPPRPDPGTVRLELAPNPAAPGQEVELTVVGWPDAKVSRGVEAYLECWNGEGWLPRFILITSYGGFSPQSQLYGPHVIDAVGLPGPGPEAHVLPSQLEPGWYRIRKPVEGEELLGYLQIP